MRESVNPIEVSINYPWGVTDNSFLVTRMGNNTYRLERGPLSFLMAEDPAEIERMPSLLDVIEAEELANGQLRFIRVVERAALERYQFLIDKEFAGSSQLADILSHVTAIGGRWEWVFGGVLIVFVPKNCGYDPSPDVNCVS